MSIRIDEMRLIEKGNTFSRYKGIFASPKVLEYDGLKELIPENELFSKETIDSFVGIPVTMHHPENGEVTSDNYKNTIIGSTISAYREGNVLMGDFVIYDKDIIQKIDSGELKNLSIGRKTILEKSNTSDSDYVQTKIKGNHLAIAKNGRNHDAQIIQKLDEETGHMPEIKQPEIKIDEVIKPYQIKIDELQSKVKEHEDLMKVKQSELDQYKIKIDELEKSIPSRVEKYSQERILLEKQANAILENIDVSKLKNDEIKDKVIEKVLPYPDGIEKSDVIRNAQYQAALSLYKVRLDEKPSAIKEESKDTTFDYLYNLHNKKLGEI